MYHKISDFAINPRAKKATRIITKGVANSFG